MRQTQQPELKSLWRDGTRLWEVVDITIMAEEPYFHLKLLKGRHPMPTRVVGDVWFWDKKSEVQTSHA
jgi:hypothetical protein